MGSRLIRLASGRRSLNVTLVLESATTLVIVYFKLNLYTTLITVCTTFYSLRSITCQICLHCALLFSSLTSSGRHAIGPFPTVFIIIKLFSIITNYETSYITNTRDAPFFNMLAAPASNPRHAITHPMPLCDLSNLSRTCQVALCHRAEGGVIRLKCAPQSAFCIMFLERARRVHAKSKCPSRL